MGRRVSRRSVISRLLDEIRSPVYVVRADRRIAYANAALGAWLELDPDAIAGLECQYSVQSASPVAGLCPPPEVFRGGTAAATVWRASLDGQTEYRRGEFVPWVGDPGQGCAVLAVLEVESHRSDGPEPAGDRTPTWVTTSVELHHELWRLRGEVANTYALEHLIGRTPAMQRVQQLVRTAAHHPGNVLIVGEAGTGREHVARTIYRCGADPDADVADAPQVLAPLAVLAAPVLDTELLETTVTTFLRRSAELEEPGLPRLLILDADQLEESVQEALYELLDVHELELRCLSTAGRSLRQAAHENLYHEGLAYALSSLEIELPQLVERREDIPLLVQHFVERWNLDAKRQVQGFTEEALGHFLVYPWSANLRELEQLVEEACRAATAPLITVEQLPFALRAAIDASLFPPQPPQPVSLDAELERVERRAIEEALRYAEGNRAKAARMLEISRARLLRRIDHFQLGDPPAGAGSEESS